MAPAQSGSTAISSAALPEHCYYCFEIIAAALKRQSEASIEVPFDDQASE